MFEVPIILNMKVTVIKIKQYQLKNILIKLDHTIRYHNNLKNTDSRKIQLKIAINFISSKDNDEEHAMHSKSDHKEIKINDKLAEVIENHSLIDNIIICKHE